MDTMSLDLPDVCHHSTSDQSQRSHTVPEDKPPQLTAESCPGYCSPNVKTDFFFNAVKYSEIISGGRGGNPTEEEPTRLNVLKVLKSVLVLGFRSGNRK